HGWEKCALAPVNPLHKARHPSLPPADSNKRIIPPVRLFTQPGPDADMVGAKGLGSRARRAKRLKASKLDADREADIELD
ncbi:MAG: hypothetical protein WB760_15910, partial [Xanthobacteraceae bacterium]